VPVLFVLPKNELELFVEIYCRNTGVALIAAVVLEYQFSGMSGSKPLFMAKFSKNILLFCGFVHPCMKILVINNLKRKK
jgi:hypothetical protein